MVKKMLEVASQIQEHGIASVQVAAPYSVHSLQFFNKNLELKSTNKLKVSQIYRTVHEEPAPFYDNI